MTKRILGPGIGAALGGFVGYSQVLCFNGQCMLTGTWLGGAILGGIVGYLLTNSDPKEPEHVPVRVRKDR